MTILLLKGYNNYFNRIVKYEADITAYKTASTSYLEYPNVNFDPQDGIMTSIVVGGDTQKKTETVNNVETTKILDFESGGSPDYFIVHDNTTIHSRWFIVECVRVRAGQYKLALKRDVLVDFNTEVMNSPCFVEKGSINDYNNPLLLNSEGMSFNQIKSGEEYLWDNSRCAWLVGYLKRDLDATDLSSINPITYTIPGTVSGDITPAGSLSWADCITYRSTNGTTTSPTKSAAMWNDADSTVKFRTFFPAGTADYGVASKNIRLTFSVDGSRLISNDYTASHLDWEGLNSCALDVEFTGAPTGTYKVISYPEAEQIGKDLYNHTFQWGYITEYYNTLIYNTKYAVQQGGNPGSGLPLIMVDEDLASVWNGKIIYKDNKYYRLQIGGGTQISKETTYTGNDSVANNYLSQLYYNVKQYVYVYRNQDNPDRKKIKITTAFREYQIIAQEIPLGITLSYNLPAAATRQTVQDAMYDMFAIPVNPKVFGIASEAPDPQVSIRNNSTLVCDVSACTETSLALATQICTKLGAGAQAGYIYDLQLLPYCPIDKLGIVNRSDGKTWINISQLTSGWDYTIVDDSNNNHQCIIFYPSHANFSRSINYVSANESIEFRNLTMKDLVFKYEGNEDDYDWYFAEPCPWRSNTGYPNVWDGPELPDGAQFHVSCSKGYAPVLYFGIPEDPEHRSPITVQGYFEIEDYWIIPDDAEAKKIKSQTDFYRLTSPNYNGTFEFNKTKLIDGILGFDADLTYKPYSPYIKINPIWEGSYYQNKDYNDSMGLICNGDFSIPMMTDAFTNYELGNKNYQAIFNRQVASLDVNQNIAAEQQKVQGTLGILTGTVGGGAAGAMAGAKAGPYGAIAGAAVGTIGGAATTITGYLKDKEWLAEQQADARSYMIDNFNYQLGNIKALPQTLSKSTPLTNNNKCWPILEYYTCTDEEKQILKDKIRWDGMTIMAIGKLKDYSMPGRKLKGKLIRLEGIQDDSHIANAIYEEVDKGFYEGE